MFSIYANPSLDGGRGGSTHYKKVAYSGICFSGINKKNITLDTL